ncbi:dinuclear metal center YbgI/SA1388 family protein [Arcanobacterium wilhelmae]|uniref:GTP cyclohydrolase 1 type 2 homolog n=1 Tax=Arcanobacterium wilhelmae TaxID=1803177 RepID=A0ABT9N925_9ACTO|nr:Nif3-like dinuclear metal center hexameric protein [Arcanobacterium wilhelmae]MDP9800201.1 dinuclear metal center YbgI/SA1388 family protein [Arcanobacterium wilhelmae]WFN89642.1 Nif3-like dinuclear metal center hexameric protein [Arcanobacterium wilhelmae]
MTHISDVVNAIETAYPPALAEDWDRVGLVVGDPAWEVTKVGFAVDPCEATVTEAIERGAHMLITHHPLYLRGTSFVAATGGKGSWVTSLIQARVGLLAAHTNADAASTGTAQAMADLLGLENVRPLDPNPDHPELGIGRVGELPLTMSVRELAERLKALIPQTPAGITVGGDPERIVKTVALSPGSGDSYLSHANHAGADVYITADLRHHPATDHLWAGGCALIGLTHFASEWPLLPKMREHVAALGVDTYVSTLVTDPWTLRI